MNWDSRPAGKLTFFIHSFVWVMLFISPLLLIPQEFSSVWFDFYWRFFGNQLLIMGVFYLNYLYLINRYLFQRQLQAFVLCNIVIIAIAVIGWYMVDRVIFPFREGGQPPMEFRHGWILRILRDMSLYVLTAALSVAIKMTARWYKTDSQQKELEKNHAQAELRNLKSQLNPHFLFNTLNNIYSLIAISPEKAQTAVHQLSKLLRYVLYDNNQAEVSLHYEIEFMQSYLELVRLRFPSKVDIRFDIKGNNAELPIAPLLFISLVENAFKHGVSSQAPSFVHITLDVQKSDELIFEVENSYFPKDNTDRSGSGIGLENLRRRLQLMYPQRSDFVAERRGDMYFTQLKITF